MGVELDAPRITEAARTAGLTNEIGVGGNPVLEAERQQANDHRRALRAAAEVVDEMAAQVVDVEVGRVDHDVCPFAKAGKPRAFV